MSDIRIGKGKISGIVSIWILEDDLKADLSDAACIAAQFAAIILGLAEPVDLK